MVFAGGGGAGREGGIMIDAVDEETEAGSNCCELEAGQIRSGDVTEFRGELEDGIRHAFSLSQA